MNINKKVAFVLIIVSCGLASGCASNATAERMAYISQTTQKPHNKALMNNITVGMVDGGKETNPMWKSQVNNSGFKNALEESLQNADLYASTDKAKYTLNATLNKLDQPVLGGFNMTVSCNVHYNLVNTNTKQVVYDKSIDSTYTASAKTFLGVIRLRKANEGAIRANIEKLVNDLYRL